jgi:hypothetical protein
MNKLPFPLDVSHTIFKTSRKLQYIEMRNRMKKRITDFSVSLSKTLWNVEYFDDEYQPCPQKNATRIYRMTTIPDGHDWGMWIAVRRILDEYHDHDEHTVFFKDYYTEIFDDDYHGWHLEDDDE